MELPHHTSWRQKCVLGAFARAQRAFGTARIYRYSGRSSSPTAVSTRWLGSEPHLNDCTIPDLTLNWPPPIPWNLFSYMYSITTYIRMEMLYNSTDVMQLWYNGEDGMCIYGHGECSFQSHSCVSIHTYLYCPELLIGYCFTVEHDFFHNSLYFIWLVHWTDLPVRVRSIGHLEELGLCLC